jgi:hypothetical protein
MGIGGWIRPLLMKEDSAAQIIQLKDKLDQQRAITGQVIQLVDFLTNLNITSEGELEKISDPGAADNQETRQEPITEDLEELASRIKQRHDMGVKAPTPIPEDADFDELLKRQLSSKSSKTKHPQKPSENLDESLVESAQELLRRYMQKMQLEIAEDGSLKPEIPLPTYVYSKEKISLTAIGAGVIALFTGWMSWLSLKVIAQGETLAAIAATIQAIKN